MSVYRHMIYRHRCKKGKITKKDSTCVYDTG